MKAGIHPREQRLLEKQRVDSALTEARTQLVKLRSERDAMVLAMRRGELIKRFDAKLQLSFGITALRQCLMSFSYALSPRLVGKSQHEIGQLLDAEMRLALRDVASWPERMVDPNWSENIDADLMPAPEVAGNGDSVDGSAAKRERANARRRERYAAKAKEG